MKTHYRAVGILDGPHCFNPLAKKVTGNVNEVTCKTCLKSLKATSKIMEKDWLKKLKKGDRVIIVRSTFGPPERLIRRVTRTTKTQILTEYIVRDRPDMESRFRKSDGREHRADQGRFNTCQLEEYTEEKGQEIVMAANRKRIGDLKQLVDHMTDDEVNEINKVVLKVMCRRAEEKK